MKKKEKTALAKNIIMRRKALGMRTARELAERARIPYGTLRDIEAGYSDGWRETREAIAGALNCGVDELSGPTPKTEPEITEKDIRTAVVEAVKELFPDEFPKNLKSAAPPAPRGFHLDPPPEIAENWGKLSLNRQLLMLFLATGEEKYKRILGQKIISHLEAVLRMADQGRQQSKKVR